MRLDAAAHVFDPSEDDVPYSLVFNRASPSAYLRGHRQSTFHTLHWLRHLERIGMPGRQRRRSVYAFELSKASQLDLLEELGLPYPRGACDQPSVARRRRPRQDLRYPVLVKANIGGSGAGIVRYETEAALAGAIERGEVELGVDGVALVQESAPLRDGHIVRVETLGGKYLYAIKVYPGGRVVRSLPGRRVPDDERRRARARRVRGRRAEDRAPRRRLRRRRAEIIEQVEAISRRAGLDVGGIEYLVDDRDGKHYFYDINALSNFVADPVNVIGFDPWAKLVDYLECRGVRAARQTTERNKERTTFQRDALP